MSLLPSLLNGDLSLISTKVPLVNPFLYEQLGLSVTDLEASENFYEKVGFKLLKRENGVSVLVNAKGLQIHAFKSDRGHTDNKNILMDFPENKYAGINHMSFSVPFINAARQFLESRGATIKDERRYPGNPRLYAIFIRDLDMTTLEFENNNGEVNDESGLGENGFTEDMIASQSRIDHVGIRCGMLDGVYDPLAARSWYAEKLGFIYNVNTPPIDIASPLKNGRPLIPRSKRGIDVNLIINCNQDPVENVLIEGGAVLPGIIYVSFLIEEDSLDDVEARFKEEGVEVIREDQLATSKLACISRGVLPSPAGSIFIQDPYKNIIRLMKSY